jgi:hypothetical protein
MPRNETIKRMSDSEHVAVSILRAHGVPHMSRKWEDYELAKHYIELQEWSEPQEYAAALRVAAEWVGI